MDTDIEEDNVDVVENSIVVRVFAANDEYRGNDAEISGNHGNENQLAMNAQTSNREGETGTPTPTSSCDENLRPFRRSSSLKITRKTGGSGGGSDDYDDDGDGASKFTSATAQKKIVRFADMMGLDLTDVRTFLDELPAVPKSAYQNLTDDKRLMVAAAARSDKCENIATVALMPAFKSPIEFPNFLERVRDNCVCLEMALVKQSPVLRVMVRNLDFQKSVYVRYTSDNWRNYAEVQATYVPDTCDHFCDKFAFVIYLYNTITTGQRLEIAIRYHCRGSTYWDNNGGNNYVFQCISTNSPASTASSSAPFDDMLSHFY